MVPGVVGSSPVSHPFQVDSGIAEFVEVILVESAEPNSPYGIKGVGEIGLVPTAGAVAAAMHARDGQWPNELPLVSEANRERATAWS